VGTVERNGSDCTEPYNPTEVTQQATLSTDVIRDQDNAQLKSSTEANLQRFRAAQTSRAVEIESSG